MTEIFKHFVGERLHDDMQSTINNAVNQIMDNQDMADTIVNEIVYTTICHVLDSLTSISKEQGE